MKPATDTNCTICGEPDAAVKVRTTIEGQRVTLGVACGAACGQRMIERAERWPQTYGGVRAVRRGRGTARIIAPRRDEGITNVVPIPAPSSGRVAPLERREPERTVRGDRLELVIVGVNGALLDRTFTALDARSVARCLRGCGLSEVVAFLVDGAKVRHMIAIDLPHWTPRRSRFVLRRYCRAYGRRLTFAPLASDTQHDALTIVRKVRVQRVVTRYTKTAEKAARGGNIYAAMLKGRALAYIVAKSIRLARRVAVAKSADTLVRVPHPDKVRGALLYA